MRDMGKRTKRGQRSPLCVGSILAADLDDLRAKNRDIGLEST